MTHGAQVMADQQNSGVIVLIKTAQQAKNLRLGGRFHRIRRLIGDQQAWLIRQGNRNHYFLTLTFREFIGKLRMMSL